MAGINKESHIFYFGDIIDGLLIGDGSTHKTSKEDVFLIVGENDQDYFSSEIAHLIHEPHAALNLLEEKYLVIQLL